MSGRTLRACGLFALLVISTALIDPGRIQAEEGLEIGDRVWQDLNADGIQNPGEPGLEGIDVQLFKVGYTGQHRPTQTTDAAGRYVFTDLSPGYFKLRFIVPSTMSEWRFSPSLQGPDRTKDSDAVPTVDPRIAEVNGISLWFGSDYSYDAGLNYTATCNVNHLGLTLGNRIWRDSDRNGLQNGTESGIAGATVELWRHTQGIFPPWDQSFTGRRVTTDNNGLYSFDCLPEGEYFIAVDGLDAFDRTSPYKSPNDDNPVDQNCRERGPLHAPEAKFASGNITLSAGGEPERSGLVNTTLDCGFTCDTIALDIVLVIDRSGSMGSNSLREAKHDAEKFVNLMDHTSQRVGIVSFADDALVESDLAQPASHAITTIRQMTSGGGTRLKGGLELAMSHLTSNARPGVAQVIIVLSDGQTEAKAATQAVAESARSQGMLVVAWSEGPSADNDFMRSIASGPEFFADQPDDSVVVRMYGRISPPSCKDPAGGELICGVGESTTIEIHTGHYPWEVRVAGGSFVPASPVASPPIPPWGTLPDSVWISLDPSIGQSQPGVTTYTYRTTFIAPPNAARVRVSFDAYSDDRIARVLVNGNEYGSGSGGNGLAGVPRHLDVYGATTNWLVAGGPNTIEITVEDPIGGHTGLNLSGVVSFCPSIEPGAAPPAPIPVEIQMSAFIPFDNADDPLRSNLVGEGDIPRNNDRNARPDDPHGDDGFRMRSRIVVNPIRMLDTGNGGILEEEERFFGMTREYDKASSLDAEGFLTDVARNDTILDDDHLKVFEARAEAKSDWNVSTNWLGDRVLEVTLRGTASPPVIAGLVPGIDWDMKVIIDATDPNNIEYTVSGEHDGYPSYDLLINCEDVYFAPVAEDKDLWDLFPPMEHSVERFSCNAGECGENFCD